MPKTQKDLIYALLEKSGGKQGKLLLEQFKQQAAPNLKMNEEFMNQELSDEEFEDQLKKMEAELPAFMNWLMSQNLPPPPSDWGTQN